jgi:hypothetical protein
MAKEKSYVEKSSLGDPQLLGVAVPLSVTKSKATEVASAWKECAVALYASAKTKFKPEKPAAAASATSSAPTISA